MDIQIQRKLLKIKDKINDEVLDLCASGVSDTYTIGGATYTITIKEK